MTVWYNSYNNKILSDRAHEEYFDSQIGRAKGRERL